MANEKVALVIGAGDATGGAIARRFAREGFTACVTRRNADKLAPLVARIESEGGKARAFGSDARKEEQMGALAQSMARELGPQGIHVAHVVIDGAIDTEFIRSNFPARAALKDQDVILSPDAIAEVYWQLHLQPRSAWTHEMDLRPWLETW